MTDKLKVGVIFGGRSGEHAVSLMSARFVLAQLSPDKYDVTEIGITRAGEWYSGENTLQAMIDEDTSALNLVTILPDPSCPGLYSQGNGGELLEELDVVFPVLHGTFGEDGTLQGLLEMAGLAYVGPGVTGSAVGMDKKIFFDVMRANQIPVVNTFLMLRSEMKSDMDGLLSSIETHFDGEYPLFVKPANLGSSVGVSKIKNRSDLMEGLMEAGQYDRRVIVQTGLNVREIEVSVMGNDAPLASVCGEVLPGEEFYSYDAKYHDESSQTVIPADIPEELSERIRALAVQAYKACDLAGLARIDFFIDTDINKIYLNELNTIPGFTEISIYPLLWAASGVGNQELVENLIGYAMERKAQRDATTHTFRRVEQ